MLFVDEQLKKKIEELERSEGFVQVIFNDATKEEREKINQVIEECLQQRMEKVESKLNVCFSIKELDRVSCYEF